jgi:GNAT superfamily N-acetyltransferase
VKNPTFFAICSVSIFSASLVSRSRLIGAFIDPLSPRKRNLDEVIDLYAASTLGERRPMNDRNRMALMLRNANLVVTAWDANLLVGISRALSDFSYATYLSDLAVRLSHQRRGIGRELIRQTPKAGGPQTRVILLSAPAATDYYPHIGFTQHPSAWMLLGNAEVP